MAVREPQYTEEHQEDNHHSDGVEEQFCVFQIASEEAVRTPAADDADEHHTNGDCTKCERVLIHRRVHPREDRPAEAPEECANTHECAASADCDFATRTARPDDGEHGKNDQAEHEHRAGLEKLLRGHKCPHPPHPHAWNLSAHYTRRTCERIFGVENCNAISTFLA